MRKIYYVWYEQKSHSDAPLPVGGTFVAAENEEDAMRQVNGKGRIAFRAEYDHNETCDWINQRGE